MSDEHAWEGNIRARLYERVRDRGYDSLTAFAEAHSAVPLYVLADELGKDDIGGVEPDPGAIAIPKRMVLRLRKIVPARNPSDDPRGKAADGARPFVTKPEPHRIETERSMKLETSRPLTLVAALAALSTVHCGGPLSEDGTGEPSLAHVSQAQIPECHLVTENPTYDIRWTQGLSLTLDETILRDYWPSDCVTYGPCNISYYRIQWFDGTWSQYYTPGSNDVDWVTNYDGTQRRVWSYFYDHPHQYQYCTN